MKALYRVVLWLLFSLLVVACVVVTLVAVIICYNFFGPTGHHYSPYMTRLVCTNMMHTVVVAHILWILVLKLGQFLF